MGPQEQEHIIKTLEERFAKHPCPRCGNQQFNLAEGYFNQTLQAKLEGIVIGGPSIPSVVVVCNRCGFISQHALGVLGMLPKNDNQSKDEPKS